MNPLFMNNMMTNNMAQQPNTAGPLAAAYPNPTFNPATMNPLQKMQYFMQAMTDPAGFMVQRFPDIPQSIRNDPPRIMQYLQQTRNISNEQIQQTNYQMQQAIQQMPH